MHNGLDNLSFSISILFSTIYSFSKYFLPFPTSVLPLSILPLLTLFYNLNFFYSHSSTSRFPSFHPLHFFLCFHLIFLQSYLRTFLSILFILFAPSQHSPHPSSPTPLSLPPVSPASRFPAPSRHFSVMRAVMEVVHGASSTHHRLSARTRGRAVVMAPLRPSP